MSKLPDNDNAEVVQTGPSVDELISAYQVEKRSLEAAVGRGEIEEIRACDKKFVALFDALLAVSPRDQSEKIQLVGLLLDELCPKKEESNLHSRIKAKIMELTTQSMTDPSGPWA